MQIKNVNTGLKLLRTPYKTCRKLKAKYKKISGAKAAADLDIPVNTMYAWTKAAREGEPDIGSGSPSLPLQKELPRIGLIQWPPPANARQFQRLFAIHIVVNIQRIRIAALPGKSHLQRLLGAV